MKPLFIVPEENIDSALFLYVYMGIMPGSFTTWLLAGDIERAKCSAHPMLLNRKTDVVRLMHDAVQSLPACCINTNIQSWNGFKSLNKEDKEQFLLDLKLKGLNSTYDKIVEAEKTGI